MTSEESSKLWARRPGPCYHDTWNRKRCSPGPHGHGCAWAERRTVVGEEIEGTVEVERELRGTGDDGRGAPTSRKPASALQPPGTHDLLRHSRGSRSRAGAGGASSACCSAFRNQTASARLTTRRFDLVPLDLGIWLCGTRICPCIYGFYLYINNKLHIHLVYIYVW